MIFPFYSDAQKILSGSPIENLKSVTGKLDARLKKLEGEGKKPGMFFSEPEKNFDFATNTKFFAAANVLLETSEPAPFSVKTSLNISPSRTMA